MKKFTATDLGGVPVNAADLAAIFNSEIWGVIDGRASMFDPDTEGVVVSGCVVTANAGNFDMTAGIVYQDGQFRRIPAAINQTYPKFIVSDTDVNDTRTFADGSSHAIAVTKASKLAGANAGQGISIANLTDILDRKWNVAETGWTNATLINGWAVYSGNPLPKFRINRFGKAEINILGGLDGAAASAAAAFNLTSAYRTVSTFNVYIPTIIANTSLPSTTAQIVVADAATPSIQIIGFGAGTKVRGYQIYSLDV